MNNYQLTIKVDDKQVVLERILQVTRYRGFLISGIHAEVNTGTHIGTIVLSVRSERPISLLTDQINKLIDIKEVKVDNDVAQQINA
ncbi:acetolactate synthase 2 small subunit [Thalassotalea atypica]|uniref:acetolactate synthase 2 small subunit n=1 Tax=Thalassotalea atypica TaxID=2054316 RepID=UPI00257438DF|nr:acetolactate synthase 2 small subunit [Thalassotalea atypica]